MLRKSSEEEETVNVPPLEVRSQCLASTPADVSERAKDGLLFPDTCKFQFGSAVPIPTFPLSFRTTKELEATLSPPIMVEVAVVDVAKKLAITGVDEPTSKPAEFAVKIISVFIPVNHVSLETVKSVVEAKAIVE